MRAGSPAVGIARLDRRPAEFADETTVHPALIPQKGVGRSRRLPAIPAHQRLKAPLSPRIPAYPRSVRNRQDRPVTPEVAGSSPVAPVQKVLQTEIALLAWTTSPHARHTGACSKRPQDVRNDPGARSRTSQAKSGASDADRADTSGDHTSRPEVIARLLLHCDAQSWRWLSCCGPDPVQFVANCPSSELEQRRPPPGGLLCGSVAGRNRQ